MWRLVLVGLGTATVPLDTAVNIAFPDITHSFGLPIAMIQWVVICYVLTYASLMLAFGRVGDMFGHGVVFRAGLLWNSVAFLLCAAAPNFGTLLFCRFLQGIGAGLVISVAPALVTGLFPESRRSRALGVFTMMIALGSACGPLLGGALVARWGWPGVFWFRVPIAVLPLVLLRGLPAPSQTETREPLDILGAALLAVGISALLLAINQSQHLAAGDWLGVPAAALAVAALFAFIRREGKAAQPIVDLAYFRNPAFSAINLGNLLVNLSFFAVLLIGPYYLVRYTGLSLPAAGGVLACGYAGMFAASPLVGRIIERVSADAVAAVGALLVGLGLFLVGGWNRDSTLPAIVLPLLIQGAGLGAFQVAYTDIVMRTLPRQRRGVAGSLAMLTRTLGVVSGATVLTLVFHLAEAAARHGGESTAAAFLAAFHLTFRGAGVVAALSGTMAPLALYWMRRSERRPLGS
ncbi:MAG TPA: MFS transporter [Acetobacteraceae bacterium]|nr:MFS transporter [Acetobacteraceae bacterium]